MSEFHHHHHHENLVDSPSLLVDEPLPATRVGAHYFFNDAQNAAWIRAKGPSVRDFWKYFFMTIGSYIVGTPDSSRSEGRSEIPLTLPLKN